MRITITVVNLHRTVAVPKNKDQHMKLVPYAVNFYDKITAFRSARNLTGLFPTQIPTYVIIKKLF